MTVEPVQVSTEEAPQRAASNVRLSKTQYGYTWSLTVHARNTSTEGFWEAMELALGADAELRLKYSG